MSQLLRSLAVSGSRKSDGTANASGKVFLYTPGTTTIVPGWKDDLLSEAWTIVDGGIPLDAGGKVKIWINDPVTVVVSDSDGSIVDTFDGFNKTRAEQVEVENENYTGALIDDATGEVTQGLGGRIDLDTVLTRAADSLGTDFEYKESAGAVSRSYIEVITGIRISVKDFGAVGNGIHDDYTAIQAALTEGKRLSATVLFEQGTYAHSLGLTLTGATGVHLTGPGILSYTGTAADQLTLSGCGLCSISGLQIYPQSGTTGAALKLTSCSDIVVSEIIAFNAVQGIDLNGGSFISLNNCDVFNANGATGRALRSTARGVRVIGGKYVAGSGAAMEFAGAAADTTIMGAGFSSTVPASSPTGILFNANLSGSGFGIFGCPTLGSQTLPIDLTGVAVWPAIRQRGNGVYGTSTSSAVGAAQTPSILLGNEIRLTAASGGAGVVTVNAPAVLPSGADADDLYYDFVFKNASAGAVTWTMNAIYVLDGAVAIPTTNAHTIQLRFRWDSTTSKLREAARADTVT